MSSVCVCTWVLGCARSFSAFHSLPSCSLTGSGPAPLLSLALTQEQVPFPEPQALGVGSWELEGTLKFTKCDLLSK